MAHPLAAVLFAQGLAHQMRWNDVGTFVGLPAALVALAADFVMHPLGHCDSSPQLGF